MDILDGHAYAERLAAAPRPGAEKILAFLDYRVGAICTDPRFLLVPLDDHLCHRGDGVFESMVWSGGRMFQLDAHLERLKNSATALKLAPPCSWEELRALVLETARAARKPEGSLRLLLGRGPGGFGISPAECPFSSLYIIAMRGGRPSPEWYEKGLTAFRSALPARESRLARIKHTNYLPNVLMTAEAAARGEDIALSFDENDYLAEAAIANVGLIDQDGTLVVPEFTHSLPGTTVLKAMELAASHMPVQVRPVREGEIFTARELLLFSTTPACASIVRYEGRPVGDGRPGPVAELLRRLLWENLFSEGVPL